MFETELSCPIAIADEYGPDCKGEKIATQWAVNKLQEGERLTIWVPLKGTVHNNEFLRKLSNAGGVDVVSGRGSSFFRASGPVVGFYVHRADLSQFNDAHGMTALAVVTSMHSLNVWAEEINAEVLYRADEAEYKEAVSPMSDVARKELERVTRLINTNNHLSTHFEKKYTVEALKKLRASGDLPEPGSAVEWAAAHGWRHDNPKILGEWVEKIAQGRNLRY